MTLDDPAARSDARLTVDARDALGLRVRQLCDGRFSQRGLATTSGVPISTVRQLWCGRTDPQLSTLLAIVGALGLRSIEELLAPLGTQVFQDHQRSVADAAAESA